MIFVDLSIEPMGDLMDEDTLLTFIGEIAGECYNSSKARQSCINRALTCIKNGHHSPWEHYNLTFKCVVDRGVSHALVRHRHCAFQQSSTIYQRYKDDIKIVGNALDVPGREYRLYEKAEETYHDSINKGVAPSRARDVLPTALATNLIITTNIREYMYILQRRVGPGDSDNMHKFVALLREQFKKFYPKILKAFDAWYLNHPL